MSDAQDSGNETRQPNLRQLAREATQSLNLRRELAELELSHDRILLQRFASIGGVAVALIVIGVSLLLVTAAWELSAVTNLSFTAWLALFGAACLVPGSWALWRSIRTLRREFCGLRGTLNELREDLAWLRDLTHREDVESE
jgi:uncharacterized membrane protein YqjE